MATLAKPGIGAILNWWDTAGDGAWTEIVEVTQLSWGGASRQVIETFKLNNVDDYVDKLQGVLNAGQVSATINYTRDQWLKLKSLEETRGTQEFQLILPDGEALEFGGFISELPLDVGSDDVMMGEVTIEISGKVDFVSTATVATPA